MNQRPHPFTLVFGSLVDEHFPAIRDSVGATPDRDRFLLAQPVVELLQLLRPEGGVGEAMEDFVAFAHAAFRFWADGSITRDCDVVATHALCAADARVRGTAPEVTQYLQLAPHLVWAQLADDTPHEPLDGWFAIPDGERLQVVACFGVHPERPGLSVVALTGGPPGQLARADGSPLFAPTMTGGAAAGLHAVAAPEELLLLAWRAAAGGEG